MKTVRFYRPHGGHVARLTEDEAKAAVGSGKAMYCPKHWYRAAILKGGRRVIADELTAAVILIVRHANVKAKRMPECERRKIATYFEPENDR